MEGSTTLRGARDENEPLTPEAAVAAAAAGGDAKKGEHAVAGMSAEDRASALAWFMEDDSESGDEPLTYTFSINVAGPDEPERLLNWTIRALDMDTIDSVRQRARGGSRANRRRGELGEVNEMRAALGIVAAATVDPNLEEVRRAKPQFVNNEMVLQHRFRHKPGLILQISGKVMELSGYDEDDVKEAVAAKNS